jgi:PAS domain S-box-containing protein
MNPDTNASTVEELQREVSRLKQQHVDIKHLASFTEHNPTPIFEFNINGQLLYLNMAAQKTMSDLGVSDAAIFLPDDFAELSKAMLENTHIQVYKILQVSSHTFEENIIYMSEYNSVRIFATDVTRRFLAEEELHQAHEKLEKTIQERTQELVEANLELQAEIEERKQITVQLAIQTKTLDAQRQRFNDVLEILPAYLILLTPDYHVAFANRFFRQRFSEDHGRRCYEYLFNRTTPCENCETFTVLHTKREHHWEWLGPDNHKYDVFDFPFQDVDGSTLILEMGIDITRRKQAEEELRQSNAYNRSLLESSLDILATITTDGKIGDVNAATEAATGYSRQELIGSDFSMYFTDPEKAARGYQQVFATGKVQDYELELQHKDGHITPVVYNASLYHDENGNVAGVYAAAQDITNRKRTERQLILLNTALESAANAILLTDVNGIILWSNSSFSHTSGYLKEEVIGLTLRFLKSGQQDHEFYKNLWDTILAGKVWHGELLNRRKDGSLYYEDQVITPVFDRNGTITNFISIRQDITEKKNYEKQLIQAEKHAAIGRMVGSVTHEINNPLQTIKNCLYLIQQDTVSDSATREPLDMAISETQRLSDIVGQLRHLYRPQTGQVMSRQDLLDIINEVHVLILPHLKNSKVTWKSLPGLSHYSVKGVKDQLIEVFLNICTNAIEAMQPDGGKLSIDMVLSTKKDQVGVVVSDSGPGVDASVLPHIFEPFITTKEYGLGLGLSICYGIIEKHDGQITVTSQPGQGTSFTVWLPIIAKRNTKRGD